MAQWRLEGESLGWAPPTVSSEEVLDLLLPEYSDSLKGQGTEAFWLSPCPACHFSGKSRSGRVNDVGSDHPELDLSSPKGPTLRRAPHLCSPCLEMPNTS